MAFLKALALLSAVSCRRECGSRRGIPIEVTSVPTVLAALRSCPTVSDPASSVSPVDSLTPRQRDLLDFERGWSWHYQGSKETAVRDLFGVSLTRYLQELNALLDEPAAYVAEPALVKRLRRLRDSRRRQRTG